MGYFTAYNLCVYEYENAMGDLVTDDRLNLVVEELKKLGVINYALREDLGFYESVKWYDHDEDMLEVSKKFPDLLFCLCGEGEDQGDIWENYYNAGRMQACYAEIVIPPFDNTKLR